MQFSHKIRIALRYFLRKISRKRTSVFSPSQSPPSPPTNPPNPNLKTSFRNSSTSSSLLSLDLDKYASDKEILLNDHQIKSKIESKKYSALSLNIRSLMRNIDQLKSILNTVQPDFVLLSEIFRPHIGFVATKSFHKIEMKVRANRSGGGVGIFISSKYKYVMLTKLNNLRLKGIEIIAAKVFLEESELTLISVYRPPELNIKDTMGDLDLILSQIDDEKVLIGGDLNINLQEKNYFSERYHEILLQHNLQQIVQAPTRITASSCTLIDHVVSNLKDIESFSTHHCPADHQLILSVWGKKSNKADSNDESGNKVKKRQIHYENTNKNIFKVNWSEWVETNKGKSTNEAYKAFHETIQSCLSFDERKSNKKTTPILPYITTEILKEKRALDIKRKKFLKKNTAHNEKIYRDLKKSYNMNLKNAKNKYYGDKLSKNAKNSKEMWKIINDVLNRKTKSEKIDKINLNGVELTDEKVIADTFSNYFKNAAVDKIRQIKQENNYEDFMNENDKRQNSFKLKEMKKEDVWFLLKTIKPKSSAGFDDVPTKIMIKAGAALITPLTMIINKCFANGDFPVMLKISKVCPIHKKDSYEPSNFRPVCLQSCFSKIIEKAALMQFEMYNKENFDDRFQFAYKTNHSCLHPIILTRHLIEMEIQLKKYVMLLMIDLSLAFDTLDTDEILPKKLEFYGADEKAIGFFDGFFCNRKHFTSWKETNSDPIDLFNISCVQGSVLGPQIYNFYTMDLNNVNSECSTIRFADDTNFIISGTCPNMLIKKANEILSNTMKYLNANKLLINKAKTSYMLIKPKGATKIDITEKLKLDGNEVEKVNSARFLGVIFDDKLKFDGHFKKVKKKLQEGVRALICTRNILDYRAKLLLYHGAFKSHLDYCCIAYLDKLNKKQMNELLTLQKQAVRLIFRAKKRSHTSKLFRLSGIIPVTKLYEMEATKFIYKFKNELSCSQQPIAIREIILKKNTSRRNDLRVPDTNMMVIPQEYKKGSCLFNLMDKWNKSKESYRMSGNPWILKNIMNEDALNEIEDCALKKCVICKSDEARDYDKYKSK